MFMKRTKVKTISGWRIAPPRLTVWAYIMAFKYVFLPLLAALALLDILFYVFFREVLGSCYGVMCLF